MNVFIDIHKHRFDGVVKINEGILGISKVSRAYICHAHRSPTFALPRILRFFP